MPSEVLTPDFSPVPDEPCFCRSGKTFADCCGSTAADRPPPNGLILHKGWIDPERCASLVSRLEKQPRGRETVVDAETGEQHVDPSRITHGVSLQGMETEVLNLVADAFARVAQPGLNCEIDWFVFPSVLRYSAGGLYEAHADSEIYDPQKQQWKRVIDRDVSLLIYLCDTFTGGHVTFTRLNYSYRPGVGDLLIFPADHRYTHRAERVHSGLRYSIVSWAAAKGTPRVQESRPPNAVRYG